MSQETRDHQSQIPKDTRTSTTQIIKTSTNQTTHRENVGVEFALRKGNVALPKSSKCDANSTTHVKANTITILILYKTQGNQNEHGEVCLLYASKSQKTTVVALTDKKTNKNVAPKAHNTTLSKINNSQRNMETNLKRISEQYCILLLSVHNQLHYRSQQHILARVKKYPKMFIHSYFIDTQVSQNLIPKHTTRDRAISRNQ